MLPVVLGYTLLGLTYERERSAGMVAQHTDTLTGFLNRRGLSDWTQRASRTQPHGVIALDIDRFKTINDTHGHIVGDEVLTAIAGRIQSEQRDTDAMVRTGGEEFIIVIPGGSTDDAAEVAERLREVLERELVSTSAGAISVTASFGVSSLPASWTPASFDSALHAADDALYEAKRNGRNTVRVAAVER
ncbi:MAG: GGDEF domain-containing protein [Pseudomonadota bacterium]